MIPTEFRMEFKFCRNGSWNYLEGINSRNSTEWNPVPLPQHTQCPATPKSIVGVCRRSIWAWSTTPNPTLSQPPSSTTPTQPRHLITVTSTHHCLKSSPGTFNDHSTLNTTRTRRERHVPLKNNATTPRHGMNKRPPGATSPTATWQPDDERQPRSSSFTLR